MRTVLSPPSLTGLLPCTHKAALCELDTGILSLDHLAVQLDTWILDWTPAPTAPLARHKLQNPLWQLWACCPCDRSAFLLANSIHSNCLLFVCFVSGSRLSVGGPCPPPPKSCFCKAMFVKSTRVQIPLFLMVAFKLNCAWNCLAKEAAFSV